MLDFCGVEEHPEECLCDVIITRPLPPLQECFRDAVSEMWMGRQICELRDYSAPWTNDKILDYLTDVQRFAEAVAKGALDDGGYTNEGSHVFKRWEYVRKAVMYRMENYEDNMVDALASVGVSPTEFMLASSMGAHKRAWTDEEFAVFNERMLDRLAVYMRIAVDFNISDEYVYNLRKYWKPARVRLHGDVPPLEASRNYMRQLCLETDLDPAEIIALVESQYGRRYSKAMISKVRRGVR
jgi:hypothetical protein